MRRIVLALAVILIVGAALPAMANGQDTCPAGDGWMKVDDLDGKTYTYEGVPDGYTITDNCFKAGNDLVFGSGPTVTNTTVFNQNGKLRDISHASFLLVKIEEERTIDIDVTCDTVTVTNNTDEDVYVGHFDVTDGTHAVQPGETFVLGGNPGVRWFVMTDGQWPDSKVAVGIYEDCTPGETTTTTTTQPPCHECGENTTTTTAPPTVEEETTSTTVGAVAADTTTTTVAAVSTAADPTVLPFTGVEDWLGYAAATLLLAGVATVGLARRRITG